MVEFAVVLPVLLLLSFGTLEVGLYLQRRLILGGAAFVAARAAGVQGPKANAAVHEVLDLYAQDAHLPWIAQAAQNTTVKADSPNLLRVNAVRTGDAWTSLLTGTARLEGGSLPSIARWTASAPISQDFVPGKDPEISAVRSPTDEMIDYRIETPWLNQLSSFLPSFQTLFNSLPPGLTSLGGQDLAVALDPTEQAAAANPINRHMNGHGPSDSKEYVGIYNEEKIFMHAGLMETGIQKLETGVQALAAAYAAPSTPISPVLTAAVDAFAKVDQSINFDKQVTAVKKAEQALLLAP